MEFLHNQRNNTNPRLNPKTGEEVKIAASKAPREEFYF